MLFNYIKIACRNLLKHKSFSAINLLGLSFSMSVCLLIITIINDQLSHDNFHKNLKNIYRVITDVQDKDGKSNFQYASTAMPVAEALKNDYTGVKDVVRITKSLRGDGKSNDKLFFVKGLMADQSFLEVFDFQLKYGNPKTALEEPFTVILSEKTAAKYFGQRNPLGKTMDISNKGTYTITGVIKDPPAKSHISFDLIGSASTLPVLEQGVLKSTKITGQWDNPYQSYVYLLLEEGVSATAITNNLNELSEQHKDASERYTSKFHLQKLSDITPSPVMNNALSRALPFEAILFLGFLALVVILSACFNYTNLSVSRALTRAKEVGIRKVTGAKRSQIIAQFLSESIVFSMISLLFAMAIYKFLLGAFNQMSIAKEVSLNFEENPTTYFWFIVFSIAIGLVAGIIPAVFLSSFKPISILKNLSEVKLFTKLGLRKSLIVLQFTLSLFFIITTIVITQQSHLLMNSEYGFTKENILNIKLQDAPADVYANEIIQKSNVIQVSSSSHIPGTGQSMGERVRRHVEDEKFRLDYFSVDHKYIENLGLTLIAGNNFPKNASAQNEQFIILNEKAINKLQFQSPHEAIGKEIFLGDNDTTLIQIIGVVKDYRFRMLFMDVGAMALRYKPSIFRYANVKIRGGDPELIIDGLEKDWKKLDKSHVFDAQYFDAQLEDAYGFVKDLRGIISITAILAIIISSLGLLGMAIYNTERKVKEVGIRKIMGADVLSIVILLSKGFLLLIGISIILATPLAYFANNLWLQEIATRIVIGPGTLFVGIVILLGIGLLTIGSQAVRAAISNPINSLRDE